MVEWKDVLWKRCHMLHAVCIEVLRAKRPSGEIEFLLVEHDPIRNTTRILDKQVVNAKTAMLKASQNKRRG